MIKVENDQSGFFHHSSDLFLDVVSINYEKDSNKVYEFPCYSWVQDDSVFFEGKGAYIRLYLSYPAHKFTRDQRAHQKMAAFSLRVDLAKEENRHFLENDYGDQSFFSVVLN